MSELTVINEKFYKPIKEQFVQASDAKKFKIEINFAIQALKKNSYLQKCDANSVLEAVLNVSQTGLSLNPVLAYAYLVPMKSKCVLMPSYQGLIKLVTDAGSIKSIEVNLIYEGDDVVLDLATEQKIQKHIPYIMTGRDKGQVIGGYSIGVLQDGTKHIEIMSRKDIEDVRGYSESFKYAESKGYKNSPWHTNESEMFRKSIVRRHFKYLPKSSSIQLEKALELDNEDYDFPASFEQGNLIESLLMSANIAEKHEREIYQMLHSGDFSSKRASECIDYLKDNQVDHIQAGKNYNQGDISKSLDRMRPKDLSIDEGLFKRDNKATDSASSDKSSNTTKKEKNTVKTS